MENHSDSMASSILPVSAICVLSRIVTRVSACGRRHPCLSVRDLRDLLVKTEEETVENKSKSKSILITEYSKETASLRYSHAHSVLSQRRLATKWQPQAKKAPA